MFDEQEADRYCFLRDLPLKPRVRTLYLRGYFQNHAMVEEVASELRRDLTFREPPQGKTLELMRQIGRSKTPVSLHVRRGDSTIPVEGKVICRRSTTRTPLLSSRNDLLILPSLFFRTIFLSLNRTWRSIAGSFRRSQWHVGGPRGSAPHVFLSPSHHRQQHFFVVGGLAQFSTG